ncbi:hypothetical protein ACFY8V_24545 [Streptomyces californicus]
MAITNERPAGYTFLALLYEDEDEYADSGSRGPGPGKALPGAGHRGRVGE